jgi:hypothetical protein
MLWMNPKNYSFNRLSVLVNAPSKPGIYALLNSSRCIYIAETENIRQSLARHLHGDSPWITVWDPSSFCYELWPENSMAERKAQIVSELHPVINGWNVNQDSLSLHANS